MLSLPTVTKFLRPTWQRVATTVVLVAIAYGGYAQSWAFSGKTRGPPPPALAEPLPYLWKLWVLLISPFVIPLQIVGAGDLVATELWLFWTLQILYFYLLTCLLAFGLQKLTCQWMVRSARLWLPFTG